MSSRETRGEPWDGGPPGADSDYEDPRETLKYNKNENRSRTHWQGSHSYSGYSQHSVNHHYNYETQYSNAIYQATAEPHAAYDYRTASYQHSQPTLPLGSRKSRSKTPRSPESRARRKKSPGKTTSHTRSKGRSSSSSSSSSSDSSSSSHSSSKSSQPGSSSGSAGSTRKRRPKKSTSRSPTTSPRSPSMPARSPSTPARSPSTPARSLSPPSRRGGRSNYRDNTSPYKKNKQRYSKDEAIKRRDNSPISKSEHKERSPSFKYKHSPQRKRREQTPPKRRWDNSSSRNYKYRPQNSPPRERTSRSPERKRYLDNDRKDRRHIYNRSSSPESERRTERTNSRKSPTSKRENARDVHKSDVDRAKKLAQDCQSYNTNDIELNYESMPSPEFKPLDIIPHSKTHSSNLRSEFNSLKMKTEAVLLQPAPSSAPQFKNDGSFLEMFKKMQEETAKSEPVANTVESGNAAPVGIKKPSLPFIGKRRGGKVLKTGIVKKAKAIDEQLVDNTPKDAWSLYMQEVKKYRDTSCEEERKTRPLVK